MTTGISRLLFNFAGISGCWGRTDWPSQRALAKEGEFKVLNFQFSDFDLCNFFVRAAHRLGIELFPRRGIQVKYRFSLKRR